MDSKRVKTWDQLPRDVNPFIQNGVGAIDVGYPETESGESDTESAKTESTDLGEFSPFSPNSEVGSEN